MRVVVVGATLNFFKVGHATFRILARSYPDVSLRLVVPDPRDAARAVRGLNIEFVAWDPSDPKTLIPALNDCDSMLMAPPIDQRIHVVETYLEAVRTSTIRYIACLGIQFGSTDCRMGEDADVVKGMLRTAGVSHEVFDLPMFLENLLYQVPSITHHDRFSYPVDGGAYFSYVSCDDLAPEFARLLSCAGPAEKRNNKFTATNPTNCQLMAEALSRVTRRKISFVPQSDNDFRTTLTSRGLSSRAADDILELWKLMGSNRDTPATDDLDRLLGTRTRSFDAWAEEHACCFPSGGRIECGHAMPPLSHMY